jgi:4-amino-4-deoxy-L-arabinose transferase-like glycosyltransferase
LITACFGLLTILYAYRLGTQLSSTLGGLLSAVFLAFTPVFYGHVFYNPKDIPFAALFVASLYYLYRAYDALPRLPRSLIIKLGISIGLTMGIRIGGILLLEYLLLFAFAWFVAQYVSNSSFSTEGILRQGKTVGVGLLLTVIIAWLVMLVWWPWAQVSPFMNPLRALKEASHLRVALLTFFNGHSYPASHPPRTYVPIWLSVSLPEFYFMSLLVGFGIDIRSLIRFQRTPAYIDQAVKLTLLVFLICLPIVTAIILRAPNYDGIRHFLFVIPPLSVLAGVSANRLIKSRTALPLKIAFGLVLLLSLGATVVDMIQLHPYESIYFNRLIAGGVREGAKRFESDYWGSSYKEGAQWVIQNYHSDSSEKTLVANCAVPFLSSYYFTNSDVKDKFLTVFPDQQPQILLANTRFDCHKSVRGKVLHVVERKGVPLLYVIQVEDGSVASNQKP